MRDIYRPDEQLCEAIYYADPFQREHRMSLELAARFVLSRGYGSRTFKQDVDAALRIAFIWTVTNHEFI